MSSVLAAIRKASRLTQTELARRAHTSRPTLSAYEHGRISPTLETFERILGAAGFRMETKPILRWRTIEVAPGRIASVPNRLPDLAVELALRNLKLPLHVDWSSKDRRVALGDRRQRARAYEAVLREGRPADIEAIIDGALLADLWDELVLPRSVREAWQPLIDQARELR